MAVLEARLHNELKMAATIVDESEGLCLLAQHERWGLVGRHPDGLGVVGPIPRRALDPGAAPASPPLCTGSSRRLPASLREVAA